MPRRRHLYPQGMPERNALPELLTDNEWRAAREYVNDSKSTMAGVAAAYGITRYRMERIIAIINVEFSRVREHRDVDSDRRHLI